MKQDFFIKMSVYIMILTKIICNEISKKIPQDGFSSWSDGVSENIPSFSGDFFTLKKANKKIWSYFKSFSVPDYPRIFNIEIKISFEEDCYGTVKSFIHFLPVSDFFSEDEIYAMCSSDSLSNDDENDEWDDTKDFSSINYIGGMGSGTHYSEEFIYNHNEILIKSKEKPLTKSDIKESLSSILSVLNIKSDDLRRECVCFIDELFLIREDVFKTYYQCTYN